MAILSPSVLGADVLNIKRDLEITEAAGVKWLHVDIMDGHFVPNMSFGYSVVGALKKATNMLLDVHLMIEKPIRYVEEFCKGGADYLTVHIEADTPENIDATLDKIASLGVKPGIVVKPNTGLDAIKPYLKKCALVLVMTVEPGFGGQSFMHDTMTKVKTLREEILRRGLDVDIQVDGGTTAETVEIAAASGANVFVAGSAVFGAENPAEIIGMLREKAEKAYA